MVLINLWLIMFAIFYICFDLTTYFKDRKQTLMENAFATVGDLFYLLHLWLFTEQYLSASFTMPVAIALMTNAVDDEETQ